MTVLSAPALFESLERWTGRPLNHEASVRAVLVAGLLLFVLLWSVYLIGRVTMPRLCAFAAVVLGFVSITFVCLTDLDKPLNEEYSWIRYPTAFFLVAAAVVGVMIARHYARRGVAGPRHLWLALSAVFLLLAGDELFMLHEALGAFLRGRFHAAPMASDLVTLAYPVIALVLVIVVAVSQRARLSEYVAGHTVFLALFASAAVVFLVAQLADTFDRWIFDQLLALGVSRSVDPQRLFSDFWYPIWGPIALLNDLEEALECIASALFLASFSAFWIEQKWPELRDRTLFGRPFAARAMTLVLMIAASLASAWLASGRSITSPAVGYDATLLLGPRDGLFHTDRVFYEPRWGLLIANEGRGNVIRYQNGSGSVLPDPQGLVTDTDCVTATDEAVYASSPSTHTVFEYTEATGWRPLLTSKDGMRYPEGLVVVDSTMYIVDEDSDVVSIVDLATKRVRDIPADPQWPSPEGIAFHPGLSRVLVTDDIAGVITAIDSSGTVTLFADRSQGLANPEDLCVAKDGRIFVTDTGRREIIVFTPDGRVSDRIRFHRMYGYLVGVAIIEASARGENDRIYVINSDGFRSMSFIPSGLWELELRGRAR